MGTEELLGFATGLVRDAGRLAAACFAAGTSVADKDDGVYGEEDGDDPAVGVIGSPAVGDVVYAGRGLGSWRQAGDGAPQRLHVSATSRRRGATVEVLNQVTWSEELLVALHREVFVLPAMRGAVDVAGIPRGRDFRAVLR